MINIDVNQAYKDDDVKKLVDIEKVKGVVLYCDPTAFKYTDTTAYTKTARQMVADPGVSTDEDKDNQFSLTRETGFHYVLDMLTIQNYVPANKQTKHLADNKITYINSAMYDNKANEQAVSVLMMLPKGQLYEDIERKLIKFIAKLLIDNKLGIDKLMRGFDLNQEGSPMHLLEKEKWRKFVQQIKNVMKVMESDDEDADEQIDNALTASTALFKDNEVRELYLKYNEKLSSYVSKFQVDNRDIDFLVEYSASEFSTNNSFISDQSVQFNYGVAQNQSSSSCECARPFDTVTSRITHEQVLHVEAVYPDLIVPPGGAISVSDPINAAVVDVTSNIIITAEEFEKRQNTFNIKDFKNQKKTSIGKPINNNDPFPIDTKIKELESHIPKVKVDEVNIKLHDCNHASSIIGPEVAKNIAMIQDEILTLSKRTERRLVRLENNMATIMRNLFRTASRMQINCAYYGGQDVYGKYKGIRCLHDDRINDGQSMTLDQCLSCTRYEPIIGQVYAILDETGTSIEQVLDDMQMAYMSVDEYTNLTRTEEIHTERALAQMSAKGEKPQTFKKQWKKESSFTMDWNDTMLETQRPNVADYEIEGITATKIDMNSNANSEEVSEANTELEFADNILLDDDEYETLKFDSDNYEFESFGNSNILGDYDGLDTSSLGGTALDVRDKIVAYAKNALKLCREGKAGYSQDYRDKHLDKNLNGISYWDCSSLAEGAYKSAGLKSIAGYTKTEWPMCLPKAGGIVWPYTDEDQAKPGDLVWFTNQVYDSSGKFSQSNKDALLTDVSKADKMKIGHVGIYIGDGQYIHARTNSVPLREQINQSVVATWDKRVFAFGRPKELIQLDELAENLISIGKGFYNYKSHKFSDTITTEANKTCASQVDGVIKSLEKYGYGPALIRICNEKKLDAYLILAIIATESAGDPTNRTNSFWGLMQTDKNHTHATSNLNDIIADITYGCDHYIKLRSYLRKELRNNPVLAIHAYNAGNGTVNKACTAYGTNASTVKGGAIAKYIGDQAVSSGWGRTEKETYAAKVILRANGLMVKKALDSYM